MIERPGDHAWAILLREHGARLRAAIDRFRGRGIASTGDGFLALFDGAGKAVRAGALMDPAVAELFQRTRDTVAIYLTGSDPRLDAPPSFRNYNGPHIRLRELVFVDDNLYVFSHSSTGRPWECRDDLTPAEVAREFFEDVFYRKVGIGS